VGSAKSNWVLGMMEFSAILGSKRLRMSFSRILAKNGSRFIGRKEDIESGGLLGLGTRIMVNNFLRIGKYASLRTEL